MSKSIYIGKTSLPSQEEMARELFAWYAYAQRFPERFEHNKLWYWHAQADCQRLAGKYDLTLHTACQVTAAVSPGKDWNINIRDAELVIQAWQQFKTEAERLAYLGQFAYQTGYTWENTRNAFRILDTGEDIPPERRKTHAFAENLEFPGKGRLVTIDLHMGHILGRTRKRGSVNVESVYHLMVQAVCFVAAILGIPPEVLQSIVWGARKDAFDAGYDVESLCDLIASIVEVESA